MKISVVILSYNQDKYISDTIDSVLTQKFDGELEIIIGDDCSSDNTRCILREYEKKFPNIIKLIFHNSNLGVFKNFFCTVSHCSGDLICLCGGDDTWNENKLNTQLHYFLNNNVDVHHSRAFIVDKDGSRIGEGFSKKGKLIYNNYICASSACFTKKFFSDYVRSVDPLSKNWKMEDYPMWLFAYQYYKIGYSDVPLVNYRIISNSITHDSNIKKRIEFEENVYEIRKYFFKNNSKILNKIKSIYLGNLAYLYKKNYDYVKYRECCLSQHSIKGVIKYCLSFL